MVILDVETQPILQIAETIFFGGGQFDKRVKFFFKGWEGIGKFSDSVTWLM